MNTITDLLLEQKKQALFEQGYVHIRNAVDPALIDDARTQIDLLFEKFEELSSKHTKVHFPADPSLPSYTGKILEINKLVQLVPALKQSAVAKQCRWIADKLTNRKTFYSFDHAIYKTPGSGETSWHQDQAYKARVREMQSLHFWIPLHDISKDEGGMRYIPGSHRNGLVEHSKNPKTDTLSVRADQIELTRLALVPVAQGDIIIHLPKTLHGSTTNSGMQTRKAWILHFSPYGRFEPALPTNLTYYFGKKITQRY